MEGKPAHCLYRDTFTVGGTHRFFVLVFVDIQAVYLSVGTALLKYPANLIRSSFGCQLHTASTITPGTEDYISLIALLVLFVSTSARPPGIVLSPAPQRLCSTYFVSRFSYFAMAAISGAENAWR